MKTHSRLFTMALGAATALALATSAWAQWTNYIEVEDYNYESGQFISDATTGMDGPYIGGVYSNKVGTTGVDWHITQPYGTGTTLNRVYRTNDYLAGIYLSDRNQAVNRDRGHFSVTYNWKLAWQDPTEWQNYTRVFSNAVYTVSIFAGAQNNTGVRMSLETVTGDPTKPNRSTETLGYFIGPDTGGVDVYTMLDATDAVGLPLRIRLSGTNTLRLTQRHYSNSDYLKFVAQESLTVMPPYLSEVAPKLEETLTAMKPINITIRRGDFPVNPATVRLSVNGSDVTASTVVTSNANGAVVYYDYDRGLPVSSYVPVEVIYGDTGSPATMVTNTWNFTTPPSWPILVSPTTVSLYTNQLSGNVTVSIPRGLNADTEVQVDLTSSDPSVVVPAGSSGGVLSLVFPAGGTNVKSFVVESVGEGTAQITTQNGWGLDVAALTVNVVPTLALAMQPSQSAISCWTNSSLTLRGLASGLPLFYYTWKTNGVEVPGATASELTVSSIGLALGGFYSVTLEVTNAVRSVVSDPVNVTVVDAPPAAFTLYEDSFSRSGGLDGSKPDVQNPYDKQWIAGNGLATDGSSFVFPGTQAAYLPFIPVVGHVYAFTADINGTNGSGEWMATAYATTADTGSGLTGSPVFTLMRANHTGAQQSFINGLSDVQSFECFDPVGASRLTTVLDTTTGDSSSGWTVTVWEDGVLVATHYFAANPTINYIACGGITGAGLFDNVKLTDSVAPPAGPDITQQPASVTNYSGGSASFQVAAVGAPPLHYQWQKDNVDLPGATTTSLVVSNIIQSAAYRVVVTNAGGKATSTAAVATLLPDPGQAYTLYRESFNGTGNLSGRSPEINNLGATWSAASGITVNNEAYVPSAGALLAFLPFTPEVGHVYVVSLDMNPLSGGNEWCALGLTPQANTTAEMYQNDPAAWMLQRFNRSGSQMFINGFGASTSGPGGHAGYNTWKIVLDTTTGDAYAGWTVRFVQEQTGSFGNLLWTQVYDVNPTISYVGFGVENAGVSGNFDNLVVTDSVLPPGLMSFQNTAGGLVLNWSQGLLLEAPTVTGPWTTNSASPPSVTVSRTETQKYYRVIVP